MLLNIFCWKEVFALSEKKDLEVYFFDVGQGDSEFIITPQNHQILIDGGPDSSVLQKLSKAMPFWDRSLDMVVLSHPDKDHVAGLLEVLKIYKADYILWPGLGAPSPEYSEWLKVLENQEKFGAKIIVADSAKEILAGPARFDVLYPLESLVGQNSGTSANDACAVVKLIFGKNSFLFTGDISTQIEKKIINSAENVEAEVLKVAHHGSKYSTSELFLKEAQPKFAVIEVGKNSYGHPTPEVLQRLEKYDINVFRTDNNKDVQMASDGENIKIIKN